MAEFLVRTPKREPRLVWTRKTIVPGLIPGPNGDAARRRNVGVQRGGKMGVVRRDLGDGLVLRWPHRPTPKSWWSSTLRYSATTTLPRRSLPTGPETCLIFPTRPSVDDVTVVGDTTTGRIVSALFLIAQVWSYAGVQIAVGQPELIATHPDYRRRGLVRAQFDEIHEAAARRARPSAYIGGIPCTTASSAARTALDLPAQPVWMLNGPDTLVSRLHGCPATLDDVGFLAVEAAASCPDFEWSPWPRWMELSSTPAEPAPLTRREHRHP